MTGAAHAAGDAFWCWAAKTVGYRAGFESGAHADEQGRLVGGVDIGAPRPQGHEHQRNGHCQLRGETKIDLMITIDSHQSMSVRDMHCVTCLHRFEGGNSVTVCHSDSM